MTNVHQLRTATVEVDPDSQEVIEAINRMLELARAGDLRSVMICAISADGMALPHAYYLSDGDGPHAIAMVAKLQAKLLR